MIEAVTYGGNRPPAKAIAGRMCAEPQRGFFRRFIEALRESRSQEARRVIAEFADLRPTPYTD
ncbi:MAG TPA: hypothetical protein VFI98_11985 [Pseudolabrys sp.]|jgi:hypothetical protein|nr:hypothetical protein [Pseudolabrys sp.]